MNWNKKKTTNRKSRDTNIQDIGKISKLYAQYNKWFNK